MHFDHHENLLRADGIKSIGIFSSLIVEYLFGKVSCACFCSQAFLCPASNFPRPWATLETHGTIRRKTIVQADMYLMVPTLRANMLMTRFLPHAHFSSSFTCMRYVLDVCTPIGATATSTEVFFATDETATPHESHTRKTADFRAPTTFFHVVATKKLWHHFTLTRPNFSQDGASAKIHPARVENQCFYQKFGWAIVWPQNLCDLRAEFSWLRVRIRQGNPQGWEPCLAVYNRRTVPRHTV